MDKGYGIGAGSQNEASRQLEVHSALGDQAWKIERAEAALVELIGRLSPLLRGEKSENQATPKPGYSCDLAQQIGKHNDRIEALADRAGYIIGLLEI